MCHKRYVRERSEASEPVEEPVGDGQPVADERPRREAVLDETPRSERPIGDVVRAPVRALRRAKAVFLG